MIHLFRLRVSERFPFKEIIRQKRRERMDEDCTPIDYYFKQSIKSYDLKDENDYDDLMIELDYSDNED